MTEKEKQNELIRNILRYNDDHNKNDQINDKLTVLALTSNLPLILSDEKLKEIKTLREQSGGDIAWLYLLAIGKTGFVDSLTDDKTFGFLKYNSKDVDKLWLSWIIKGNTYLLQDNVMEFIKALDENIRIIYLSFGPAYEDYKAYQGGRESLSNKLVVNKNIADLVNLLGKSNPKYANEYFNAIVRAKTEKNIKWLVSDDMIGAIKKKILEGNGIDDEFWNFVERY